MKLFFILMCLSSLTYAQKECEHTRTTFNCVKFVRNYDGDTITFNLPGIHPFFGEHAKIRVQGIDTPELKPKKAAGPCEVQWGRIARNLVEAELKNAKRINLTHLTGRDKYGRILAQVEYDNKDLKTVLLKNQLAVTYTGKKKASVNWCDLKSQREKQK